MLIGYDSEGEERLTWQGKTPLQNIAPRTHSMLVGTQDIPSAFDAQDSDAMMSCSIMVSFWGLGSQPGDLTWVAAEGARIPLASLLGKILGCVCWCPLSLQHPRLRMEPFAGAILSLPLQVNCQLPGVWQNGWGGRNGGISGKGKGQNRKERGGSLQLQCAPDPNPVPWPLSLTFLELPPIK